MKQLFNNKRISTDFIVYLWLRCAGRLARFQMSYCTFIYVTVSATVIKAFVKDSRVIDNLSLPDCRFTGTTFGVIAGFCLAIDGFSEGLRAIYPI